MKIDHLVLNVGNDYQKEGKYAQNIREAGLLYDPKKGKATRGFKATNIWIGKEYFELISIKKRDGGGWKKEWVEAFNNEERGLICLMLDIDDLDCLSKKLKSKGISISDPECIEFKFFFNLISKTMPWYNSYLDFFQNVPMQIGFQQMKNAKMREKLEKFMVPNSIKNNIVGIKRIRINGPFTTSDFEMLAIVFEGCIVEENQIIIQLENEQFLSFVKEKDFEVQVELINKQSSTASKDCWIENTRIFY
ncbi:VOC family protein [Solibacillus silvestris]|uniref:VOC family protein n=1 Tax=Solibacillus silvestris TaxID=76853 RepID=UPI003F8027DE